MTATIVIVDDNLDLLQLWDVALAILLPDVRVLLANTAAQALCHVHENAVDMVVTDMEMPEQSGIDLIRILKVTTPNVPVLVVTGSTEDRSIRMAKELGVARSLQKPLFPDELAEAIRSAMR